MSKRVENKTKILIEEFYLKFFKANNRSPSRSDYQKNGFSRDKIRNHYGNIEQLKTAMVSKYPDLHFTLKDINVLNKKDINKFTKFVITTVIVDSPIHKQFFENLKYYCKQNNAKLLILLSYSKQKTEDIQLDPLLKNETIIAEELNLNENLAVSKIKISSTQINPLTGFKRLGRREKSLILASPKQFLEYIPIANDSSCHAIMTTGAMTLADYKLTGRSNRTTFIASIDHKLGALVVEIENNKKFHVRQIQAEVNNGYFIDLGVYYKINKREKIRPEAIVLGDKHVGVTNNKVLNVTDQMLKDLKPKRVFLHDLFDGQSVNPHASHHYLLRATHSQHQLLIKEELELCANELKRLLKLHPYVEEWLIVRSNHDEFLDRYLENGEYTKDPHNSKISHQLALGKLSGKIALQVGIELLGLIDEKIKFLDIHSSYKIADIEHGVHGHLGLNGQRNPQNSSLEIGYGAGVFGHSHSPGILREVYRVGTSTDMRLGYNKGSSSWFWTHCLTYQNGSRQLINIIDGTYKKK